ncbi:unnamed protein product [Ectocarpus sp. 8 AP-2014]
MQHLPEERTDEVPVRLLRGQRERRRWSVSLVGKRRQVSLACYLHVVVQEEADEMMHPRLEWVESCQLAETRNVRLACLGGENSATCTRRLTYNVGTCKGRATDSSTLPGTEQGIQKLGISATVKWGAAQGTY